MKIKKGNIVGRNSYGKDIFFVVERIIKINNIDKYAILKGITVRIEADAPIDDLEIIDKEEIIEQIDTLNKQIANRVQHYNEKLVTRNKNIIKNGLILHLDGDKKYSEKSIKYYRQLGLNAIVKNISENKQPLMITDLLNKYEPDILVITGHDAMLKNGRNYNDIYNYRNSKHFVNTVTEARKWAPSPERLVIFAGACQSFFEALILAGANFASSPERILIDFIDPLIVAEKVAITDKDRYITINEIAPELKDGYKAIGGSKARGKRKTLSIE